jgi:hypothetical protein
MTAMEGSMVHLLDVGFLAAGYRPANHAAAQENGTGPFHGDGG